MDILFLKGSLYSVIVYFLVQLRIIDQLLFPTFLVLYDIRDQQVLLLQSDDFQLVYFEYRVFIFIAFKLRSISHQIAYNFDYSLFPIMFDILFQHFLIQQQQFKFIRLKLMFEL